MNTQNIKLVVCDVDGTLTDGGMYITESGDHFKRFDSKDGMAVKILAQHGIEFGMISHSKVSNIVETRAKMLDIKWCYVGEQSKRVVLDTWMDQLNISIDEVAFLGDDINDLIVMKACGLGVCPADSVKAVKEEADIVLKSKGGRGCLREFVDMVMNLSHA